MASTKRSSGGAGKSTANRSGPASASKSASGTRSAKARSNGRASTAQAESAKRQSAAAKKTTRGSAPTSSRNGAKRSQNGTTAKRATASRNGSNRSGSARPRAATNRPKSTTDALRRRGSELLHVADRGGPALTVAAAAAGLVGGLVLRQRPRMADPGVATRSRNILRDVDTAAALEGLGKATAELGKRSKLIARQLDQVGDRAERFGKILS
jgi:hypothetical protein